MDVRERTLACNKAVIPISWCGNKSANDMKSTACKSSTKMLWVASARVGATHQRHHLRRFVSASRKDWKQTMVAASDFWFFWARKTTNSTAEVFRDPPPSQHLRLYVRVLNINTVWECLLCLFVFFAHLILDCRRYASLPVAWTLPSIKPLSSWPKKPF